MTLNELNSKINLPRLTASLNYAPGSDFVKIPEVGWFGFNKDRTHVFGMETARFQPLPTLQTYT